MWPKTPVTEKLKIDYPIIQAPMAGFTTPELVAAVSNEGALGSLGLGYMAPEQIRQLIQQTRELTDKPFAVNLFVPTRAVVDVGKVNKMNQVMQVYRDELGIERPELNQYAQNFDEQLAVILEERPEIFSFTFGIPSKKQIEALKEKDITLIGTATVAEEARLLEKAGIDMIVAQGVEAGGHRGSFLPNQPLLNAIELLPRIIREVNVPVIAAGGLMTADDVYAAAHLRACAVQMGTIFLTCPEAATHPKHKAAILAMKQDDTVLTRVFSGRTARAIRNRFIEEMSQLEDSIPDYPVQNAYTRDIRKAAAEQNRTDLMALWASSFAYLAEKKSAADVIRDLVAEVKKLL